MITPTVFLVPDLITLVVDEHRHHRTAMIESLEAARDRFHEETPEIVAVLSARWQGQGPFQADEGRRHATLTDYAGFGVELRYDCAGHPALARAVVAAGLEAGLRVAATVRGVGSGVTVPMHFLAPSRSVPVVPLGLGGNSARECRRWGESLRQLFTARPERIAFVVGGMLSNNEHAWSLRREIPEAAEFDERALAALREGAWERLPGADAGVAERVKPHAALRHLAVLSGFLGAGARGNVRCYEPGPGVGAALVEFTLQAEPSLAKPDGPAAAGP